MTATERNELRSLTKRRAKLEKTKAQAHGEQLIANADAEMGRRFKVEDLGIQAIVEEVAAQVDKVRALMNARLDAMGVAQDLRPDIRLVTSAGGYRSKDHRAELRREARVNIAAAVKRRLAEIDAWEVEALTELAQSALTSEAARSILAGLPNVSDSLPAVADILGPVDDQPLAVIEGGRAAKHRAILGALSSDGSRSDREIGRLLGVDHKTVAKVRNGAGEIPAATGEFPSESGDFPSNGGWSA